MELTSKNELAEEGNMAQGARGRSSRSVRAVNVLCLCGAVLGVASLFCTWSYQVSSGEVMSSGSISEQPWDSPVDLWLVGCALFLVGTALAFLTTLSGFAQFAGIIACVLSIGDRAAELEGIPASDFTLGAGLGLQMGVISASMVLFSMFVPLGPGHRTGAPALRDRLFVFGLGMAAEGASAAPGPGQAWQRLGRQVRAGGRWVSFLAAVSLVSAGLLSIDGGLHQAVPPLEQVGGGVEIDVNTFMAGYPTYWGEYSLTLSDGETSVSWNLSAQDLHNGSWCTVDFGDRSLGTLVLCLFAVELLGDGQFGAGDSLILIAQDGTEFMEDVVYRLKWSARAQTLPPGPSHEVTFVLYDGGIDSWRSILLRSIQWRVLRQL